MPFDQLQIKNFQAHSEFTLKLDPRITTITGITDSGKSALLRALKWVSLNEPRGDTFIKIGERNCECELIVDGQNIKRHIGKDGNLYFLNGQEFKAFGVEVPDQIKDILKVGDHNFQGQHDAVFWFSLSAGEVSRQLNAVVDLTVIDDSLSNIAKTIRYHQTLLEVNLDKLKKTKASRDELLWVVEVDEDYQRIETLEATRLKTAARTAALVRTIQSARATEATRQTAIVQATAIRSMGLLAAKARKAAEGRSKLGDILISIKEKQKVLEKGRPDFSLVEQTFEMFKSAADKKKSLLTLIQKIAVERTIVSSARLVDSSGLDAAFDKHQKAMKKSVQLDYFVGQIRNSIRDLDDRRKVQIEAEKELNEKTDGICPVCGSEMKDG